MMVLRGYLLPGLSGSGELISGPWESVREVRAGIGCLGLSGWSRGGCGALPVPGLRGRLVDNAFVIGFTSLSLGNS